jgi:hypothetical protein
MSSSRTLLALGTGCLLVAGITLLAGPSGFPWIVLVASGVGATALVVGLARTRGEQGPPAGSEPDVARGQRVERVVTVVMALLAIVALAVALAVAQAEAQGHAIYHFLAGLLCAGLFVALAFPWHPRPGTTTAMLRGMVLSLLAVSAVAAFVESVGGAGYDAANEARRIEALTRLHNIVTPFGALVIGAVPIGIATVFAVLIAWAIRRNRGAPA